MAHMRLVSVLVVVGLLTGCVKPGTEQPWDPLEPMNRGVFWFNQRADRYVVKPAADVYAEYVPAPVRTGVGNVFDNLRTPVYSASQLLQGNVDQSLIHVGRFLLNSTVGLVGIFDVADGVGLSAPAHDLGTAFGSWGVAGGPYLVLPLLGPSTLRDLSGRAGEYFADPFYWIRDDMSEGERLSVAIATNTLKAVHFRSEAEEAISAAQEAAVDEYLTFQGAYYQTRNGLLKDPDEITFEEE